MRRKYTTVRKKQNPTQNSQSKLHATSFGSGHMNPKTSTMKQHHVNDRTASLLPHATSRRQAVPIEQNKSKGKPLVRRNATRLWSSILWKDWLLWGAALLTFLLGLRSLAGGAIPATSITSQVVSSPEPPHAILRVNGTKLTSTQWDNAVKSAFSTRASSGEYQGGTQADNIAINTQAMHTLIDPIVQTALAQSLGISTDSSVLYQEWLSEASPQEHELAQQHENDPTFKQNQADEQLRLDVVRKVAKLSSIQPDEVYQYYLDHPEEFARSAPQMQLQQIVIKNQTQAQQIYESLMQGTSFSTLVATYDIGSPFYRNRGGDLGWVALGGSGYPPEWTAHALALRPGQFSNPFQVLGYYFILKCEAGPDYEPWPFAEVQDQAYQDLEQDRLNATFVDLLRTQEKSVQIEVLDPRFTSIVQEFKASLQS